MKRLVATAAIGLGASLLVLAVLITGVLAPLEGWAVDVMQRLRGPRPADPRIVVCAIDGGSIDRYGRWPWPRTRIASLVDRLSAAGARTIAFDVVFSEPSRYGPGFDLRSEDLALAEAMERSRGTVLSFFFETSVVRSDPSGRPADLRFRADPDNLLPATFDVVFGAAESFPLPEYPKAEPNLNLFARAAASQGFTTNRREAGVSRRQGLAARFGGAVYPALPLRAVAHFQGVELALERHRGLPRVLLGERPVEVDGTGRLWLSYPGPADSFDVIPVHEVLDGERSPEQLSELFADKLVFVGATETGIGDFTATPFGTEIPGVLVQAAVADNLLSGEFLKEAGVPRTVSFAALLLLGLLVAFLVAAVERHLVGSLVAIALVAGWPVLCFGAFLLRGWHLELVAPAGAGLLALVASLRYQVGTVDARARFIRRTFERYVSQAVVEEMLRHPERVRLGGERRELTVLFSDIRGFTSISERLAPEEVAALINGFFTPMTRVVLEQGGTLDKYMGDALMAFFGAPVTQEDHAVRACRAALAMRAELERLNLVWRKDGRLPEGVDVGLGIGLNSGPMSVGNMGSEQVFDYTVLGDDVNLGSRVEGLNKLFGTEILVTGATVEAALAAGPEGPSGAGPASGFLFRELDRVRVKGKTEPVTLFELLAELPAPAALEERARRYAEALALYRAGRFAEAAEAFEAVDRLARRAGRGDPPAVLLADRCRRLLMEPPPPGWEPVETLTSK